MLADPDLLDALADRLPGLASGLAATLAPVAAASGPDVWQGLAAAAFDHDLDGWLRALTAVESELQALSCELALQAARLRADG